MKQNKYYIFNNGRLLLCDDEVADVPKAIPEWLACESVRVFEESNEAVFHMARSEQETLPESYRWVDLRESFYVLPERVYRQAGKASELLYFDHQHQYCGICGAPMEWASAISKRCTHCNEELWPKLSTAIIVLVRKGGKALPSRLLWPGSRLRRNGRDTGGMRSTRGHGGDRSTRDKHTLFW